MAAAEEEEEEEEVKSVNDSVSRSKVLEFQHALQTHVKESAYSKIRFVECTNPQNDPNEDDYTVVYEALFEPRDLDHAYLSIAVTEDGYVGFGFETRKRLAERLARRLWTAREAFAAGRELASVSPSELISFIRLVAQGRVMLQVGAGFGIAGYGSTPAVVSAEDFHSFASENPRKWDWVKVLGKEKLNAPWRTIVRYEPWGETPTRATDK